MPVSLPKSSETSQRHSLSRLVFVVVVCWADDKLRSLSDDLDLSVEQRFSGLCSVVVGLAAHYLTWVLGTHLLRR